MEQPARIPAGTTRLFTVAYSSQPTGVPYLNVTIGSAAVTVFSVQASSASTAAAFQANVTVATNSAGVYAYKWTAQFSGGVDYTVGLFQVYQPQPWTDQ